MLAAGSAPTLARQLAGSTRCSRPYCSWDAFLPFWPPAEAPDDVVPLRRAMAGDGG
jgi:hypothetical protein